MQGLAVKSKTQTHLAATIMAVGGAWAMASAAYAAPPIVQTSTYSNIYGYDNSGAVWTIGADLRQHYNEGLPENPYSFTPGSNFAGSDSSFNPNWQPGNYDPVFSNSTVLTPLSSVTAAISVSSPFPAVNSGFSLAGNHGGTGSFASNNTGLVYGFTGTVAGQTGDNLASFQLHGRFNNIIDTVELMSLYNSRDVLDDQYSTDVALIDSSFSLNSAISSVFVDQIGAGIFPDMSVGTFKATCTILDNLGCGAGTFDIFFDIAGRDGVYNGQIRIDAFASTDTNILFPGFNSTAFLAPSAFVDPVLSFTPQYLAANPNASLAFSAGIGNGASGGVPEPAIWLSMLLGFGVLGRQFRSTRAAVRIQKAA